MEKGMGQLLRKKTPEQKRKTREKIAVRAEDSAGSGAREGAGAGAAKLPGKAASPVPKASSFKAPQFYTVSVQFLREVKMELKKVTWPSRKQATGSTVVMIIFVLILAIFLGMADSGLAYLVRIVLGNAQ